jgi:hypothetical protein
MSYYIIDLTSHILLGIICTAISVFSFCSEVWPCAILNLIATIGCIFLAVLDIKEIQTELWWNKQIMNKKYFSNYDDEEDYK